MNPVCQVLDITYPIIQGGMGNISNAQLAVAVSEAGGLGTIGCGTMPPDEVEQMIIAIKNQTKQPFAVNIPIQVTDYLEEMLTLVKKHAVPIVSLSAGNPAPYVPLLQEYGIKVLAVVSTVYHAKKAEYAGVDLIVAEGFEAAGINAPQEMTTFTLVPQIAAQVSTPLIAAGGVGDGKGFAAAMMLGASGVQLGTRLIATKEAPVHREYKQLLCQADGTDAITVGRSFGNMRRVLKTDYTQTLQLHERDGISRHAYQQLTTEDRHIQGAIHGDFANGFLNGGQVAGLITTIPTVKDLLDNMMNEARQQMDLVMHNFSIISSGGGGSNHGRTISDQTDNG
ncbi:NAD(P)H-dependent flavin oxidoreductase [Virgibacillus soli]|uniref:NAD(P)H-dependent flavin oxidoreductase n=1 Tax=Paracerasibacillus soli TaxID=480284 RepID=UPI0035EFAC5D